MAAGKVLIGFSYPYVAKYSASGTTVTYTAGQQLARGVSLTLDVESADDNKFYADNGLAEAEAGTFQSGSVTLTVDGLLTSAEALIQGLGTPTEVTVGTETVDVYNYGKDQAIPYVGLGVVAEYMSDGVISWTPIVLPKLRFDQIGLDMATMEEEIDWHTQELTAAILRDDTANANWRRVAEDQTTEEKAKAVVVALLGGAS